MIRLAAAALALALLGAAPSPDPVAPVPDQASDQFMRECVNGQDIGLCMDALTYYSRVFTKAQARKDPQEMCQDSLYAGVVDLRLSDFGMRGAFEDGVDLFQSVEKNCPPGLCGASDPGAQAHWGQRLVTDEDVLNMLPKGSWWAEGHADYDHYIDNCKECQLHAIKQIRLAREGAFAPVWQDD